MSESNNINLETNELDNGGIIQIADDVVSSIVGLACTESPAED